MQNPWQQQQAPAAASYFQGLDTATAFPPELPEGDHILITRKNETFTHNGVTHYTITAEVEATNNPTVLVGKTYRCKIPFLAGGKFGPDKALSLLRTYLAALLNQSPDAAPPVNMGSWAQIGMQSVEGEGTVFDGDRFRVVATPAKDPSYCKYAYHPAP